jgi:hypothetical protein
MEKAWLRDLGLGTQNHPPILHIFIDVVLYFVYICLQTVYKIISFVVSVFFITFLSLIG